MFDIVDIHPSHAVVQVKNTLSNFEENKIVTIDLLYYVEEMKKFRLTEIIAAAILWIFS